MEGGICSVGLGVDHANFGEAVVKVPGLLLLAGETDIAGVGLKDPLVEGGAVACQSNPSFTGA
jgi:hypothetical protein